MQVADEGDVDGLSARLGNWRQRRQKRGTPMGLRQGGEDKGNEVVGHLGEAVETVARQG